MSALQMLGTVIAIPLGLASGYSMYRANFSVETTCQSLRSNIVLMLDKSVDARTRRALVRHNVETFEQTCGSVDPDATAAFKALLAADQAPAATPTPVVRHVEAKPVEEKSKEVARKAEPKVEPKPANSASVMASVPASPEATPAPADVAAPISDSAWLAAVRGALKPAEASSPVEPADDATKTASLPAEPTKPTAHEARPKQELRASIPASVPAAAATGPVQLSPPVADVPSVAPPLPPPATIASAPGPAQEGDHPVPPGSVPTPVLDAPEPQSRLGAMVGKIPFVGQIIERHSR